MHRREAEAGQLRRDPGRLPRRPGLQPVIDGDPAGPQALPRGHERQRRREREGVGATRARREHEVAGPEVIQAGPNGAAQFRHSRMRAHPAAA
jgi:hypothetical protein